MASEQLTRLTTMAAAPLPTASILPKARHRVKHIGNQRQIHRPRQLSSQPVSDVAVPSWIPHACVPQVLWIRVSASATARLWRELSPPAWGAPTSQPPHEARLRLRASHQPTAAHRALPVPLLLPTARDVLGSRRRGLCEARPAGAGSISQTGESDGFGNHPARWPGTSCVCPILVQASHTVPADDCGTVGVGCGCPENYATMIRGVLKPATARSRVPAAHDDSGTTPFLCSASALHIQARKCHEVFVCLRQAA
jgi:hypothetical protein